MLQRILTPIKNFFFPRFSLSNVLILLLMLFFWLFEYYPQASGIFRGSVKLEDTPGLIIFIITIASGFLYAFLRITYIVWTRGSVNEVDKRIFSTIFYTFISIISLAAAFQSITIFNGSLSQAIQLVFIAYIALKSLGSMIVLMLLHDARPSNNSRIYALQMDDQKVTHTEALVLLVCTIVLYLILKNYYPFFASLILTYFYTSIILKLSRMISRRVIISN